MDKFILREVDCCVSLLMLFRRESKVKKEKEREREKGEEKKEERDRKTERSNKKNKDEKKKARHSTTKQVVTLSSLARTLAPR